MPMFRSGLRHGVDAPIDGGAPFAVGTGSRIWIAQRVEPARGILGPVLVVEAVDRDDALGLQPHEQRVLLATRHAPGCEDVDQRNLSQIGRAHVELQSLMRISYAVFCLKKKTKQQRTTKPHPY